jgi:hypothetical protein
MSLTPPRLRSGSVPAQECSHGGHGGSEAAPPTPPSRSGVTRDHLAWGRDPRQKAEAATPFGGGAPNEEPGAAAPPTPPSRNGVTRDHLAWGRDPRHKAEAATPFGGGAPDDKPGAAAPKPLVAGAVLTAIVVTTVPALFAFAAEPARTIDVSKVFDAGQRPKFDIALTPADPDPLVERAQWVFDLRWDHGDVWLLGTRRILMQAPRITPRAMGRFALELYEGPALIERVRFDFPMLAVPDAADAGWASPPALTRKMRTRIGVIFPATQRGTRLELWDRSSGDRWSLSWPPVKPDQADAAPSLGGAAF